MEAFSFDALFPEAKTGEVSLVRGEMLFHKGDIARHIYTVVEGGVRMVRYTLEGEVVSMHSAHPGDSFAEASLFSEIYHCDAEAMMPSTVAGYDKKTILTILQNDAEKNMAFIALFSRQIRNLRALLEVRSIRSARDRVLHYLLLQADPATMKFYFSGTMKTMAQELGMAHETLYRALAGLEKEGTISRFPEKGILVLHCCPA